MMHGANGESLQKMPLASIRPVQQASLQNGVGRGEERILFVKSANVGGTEQCTSFHQMTRRRKTKWPLMNNLMA